MILTLEAVIVSHVTSDEVESNVTLCSALWSKCILRSLSIEPNELEAIIAELNLALEGEKQKSAAQLITRRQWEKHWQKSRKLEECGERNVSSCWSSVWWY